MGEKSGAGLLRLQHSPSLWGSSACYSWQDRDGEYHLLAGLSCCKQDCAHQGRMQQANVLPELHKGTIRDMWLLWRSQHVGLGAAANLRRWVRWRGNTSNQLPRRLSSIPRASAWDIWMAIPDHAPLELEYRQQDGRSCRFGEGQVFAVVAMGLRPEHANLAELRR